MHTQTHMQTRTPTHMHVYAQTFLYTHIHTHIPTYAYTYTPIAHTDAQSCTYVRMHKTPTHCPLSAPERRGSAVLCQDPSALSLQSRETRQGQITTHLLRSIDCGVHWQQTLLHFMHVLMMSMAVTIPEYNIVSMATITSPVHYCVHGNHYFTNTLLCPWQPYLYPWQPLMQNVSLATITIIFTHPYNQDDQSSQISLRQLEPFQELAALAHLWLPLPSAELCWQRKHSSGQT